MNRRAFLGSLLAAAAGLALDPERALWVPGAKRIFLPAVAPSLVSPVSLTVGDVFTIRGVFTVHPITGAKADCLQRFVVTADVKSGEVALADVWPRPMPSGPYRNVSNFSGRHRVQPVSMGRTIPTTSEWIEVAS